MPSTQTEELRDLLDEFGAVDAATTDCHLACCERDAFYCKAPYHPEAEATPEHDEDEACAVCVEIRYRMLCPPEHPTHQHCPLNRRRWCPQVKT